MNIVAEYGDDRIAKVYVAEMRKESNGEQYLVECVESVQPPQPREKKWVLIVSSMFGCPIKCKMCDAGGEFSGKLTAEEIISQIDFIVRKRYPSGAVPSENLKIQFARMGEPALNMAVLDAMESLPRRYDTPGLRISLSTVAPDLAIANKFFDRLIDVKNQHFSKGKFQLQFSIHTTDEALRDELIPVKKWSFGRISDYADEFLSMEDGDKKITLNFAPTVDYPIDVSVIRRYFDPSKFLIKLTPLNPTVRSYEENLQSAINPHISSTSERFVNTFSEAGYEVILSIGILEENRIGSNCGQFIQRAINAKRKPSASYALDKYRITS